MKHSREVGDDLRIVFVVWPIFHWRGIGGLIGLQFARVRPATG